MPPRICKSIDALLPKGPENRAKWRGMRQFMDDVGFSELVLI